MKKKSEIKDLMFNTKEHLKSGNSEFIKNDFDQISITYSQLPDGFAHDKAVIYMDILKLFSSVYLSNHSLALSSEIALSESALLNKQAGQIRLSSNEPVNDNILSYSSFSDTNKHESNQSAGLFSAGNNNYMNSSKPSYNDMNQSKFAGLFETGNSGSNAINLNGIDSGVGQNKPNQQNSNSFLHNDNAKSKTTKPDEKKKSFFSGLFGKKDDSQIKSSSGTVNTKNKK
jgi:hypothetical protein